VNRPRGSERGSRITEWTARYTFAKLSHTLVQWYRAGLDVERELPKLATYLGHVHINDTYWYLEAVPELLQLATDRLMERESQP
jgi:integrase/recombinase XerD